MNRILVLVLASVVSVVVGCGGAQAVTEKNMLEWGPSLNAFMATNFEKANAFPDSLDEMPPMVREELSDRDGWGNKMLYRKVRIDLYNMISAGPDGEFGNDDDIVMKNGALYPAADVYAEFPLKQ